MGGRGGRGAPARDRKGETDAFIKAINEDKSISDITRRELLSGAKKSLSTFETDVNSVAQKRIKELTARLAGNGSDFGNTNKINMRNELKQLEMQQKNKTSQSGAFDKTAASLRKDLDSAREGTAPKFRFRQALEKKRELLQDRPGQRQLILSKGNR